ncbi:Hypothetical_protein [Hexamita inflata]|uniref:Hypothetical_protein n=1 Tax=Hexamita inflata TaxID=28002 RepID=A0AA86UBQ8_9EUKA|nr:Hypothetical protein HINF_LOCUS32597 [Hexamita inflata]
MIYVNISIIYHIIIFQYQKQFLKNNRTKKGINASKPQEITNPPPAIYPKLEFAKTNKLKRDLIKLRKQFIKGNHLQAIPIQRNNLQCKLKEIMSKEKLRSENQFLFFCQRLRQVFFKCLFFTFNLSAL